MDPYANTTTTSTTTTTVALGPDFGYVKSLRGILKLAEILCLVVAMICSSVAIQYDVSGGGWMQFVCVTSFLGFLVFFILHFVHAYARIPAPMVLIEFCFYLGACFCLLTAAIVAAVFGAIGVFGAASFFLFVTLGIASLECFYLYREFKITKAPVATGDVGTVESTTTTTTYETRAQY